MTKHTHGGDIYRYQNCIDFSANCNPLGTPKSVKQAIIRSTERLSDYPQVNCDALREAIAAYEGVTPDQIICGNGAAELIFSLCRAVHPAQALVLAPTFAEYEQALYSVGCEVHRHLLQEADGFHLTETILSKLTSQLDLIFLCNPNNPTGITIEHDLLLEILKRCQDLQILLVVDECFLDFVEKPEEHSLKVLLQQYDNLFLLKAFTKRYAIPGVRLGYGLTGNGCLLEQMELVTQPWNVSTMAQAAGIAALQENGYVELGRQMVFREAVYLKGQLQNLGMKVYDSEANYIFFNGPEGLFEKCLKEHILIRDCSNYPGLEKGYYRIAVKKHDANEKLIRALQNILQNSFDKHTDA